jgi:DNA repair exonuclease SbcCD ATPase subunit
VPWSWRLTCRLAALVTQNEALTAQVKERDGSIAALKSRINALDARLSDAATVLSDKERLEEQVIRQMDVVNKQASELENLREVLSARDTQLDTAQADIAELELKASRTKEHEIMFGEAWIVETSHHRLRGVQPQAREGQLFIAMHGVPCSAQHMHESIGIPFR